MRSRLRFAHRDACQMRHLFLASTIILGCLTVPTVGNAQVVTVCPTCANLIEQLVEKATQAQQLATQASQLRTELNSYSQLVTSGLTLPQSIYAQVQSDIFAVRSLANASSLLTGNSGSILTRLQNAQGYANQASYLPSNIGQQFASWQNTLGNAGLSLGRTLGVQQGQENNYTILQQAIQAHGATAAGQTQAIQAGVEMSGLVSTQLNQIQTTLTAAAQEQATRNMVMAERQALADQYFAQFMVRPDAPLSGYPRYR